MEAQDRGLLRSAAGLYILGQALNGAETELDALHVQGFALASPELVAAARRHGALASRWTRMEREHLTLRGA